MQMLFEGMQMIPPVAFVFMGNFLLESHGFEKIDKLKKLFKKLGQLVSNYGNLVEKSQFIFVPGLMDPCLPHMVPR